MLLLDAGNSRIKWAYAEDGRLARLGAANIRELAALRRAFADLPFPSRILASNVAGAEVERQLREACAAWGCEPEFIAARKEQCGVRNTYDLPAQLGSDRWAALIAAWHHEKAACLVVNCGTATTVDALSDAGVFLGGLILPGLDMMQGSLAAGTAQLEISEGRLREFPHNTADAVASGAVRATAGAIALQHLLLGKPAARCLLGGGAADRVMPALNLQALRADNMVLQGLLVIGQQD